MNVQLFTAAKSARQQQKIITLNKYIEKYPQGWKKRLELADLLYEIGNWSQAIIEYNQVIERQAQLLDVHLKLAKILQLMGQEKEALQTYDTALFLSENPVTQHYIQGLIATCKGDNEKALTAFNLAINSEPDQVFHRLALSQVYQNVEDPLGIIRTLEPVLVINPDDVMSLIYSYDALMVVGDIQTAKERFNSLIALAGDDFRVIQRQIDQRLLARMVSGEEGKITKKMITSLLGTIPHSVEVHKSLAYYHILRGDWAQGVKVLAKFTTECPNYPYGWYYYGRCLFHTGEYQQGAKMMEKAYYLYPHDREIYRRLCEILPFAPDPVKSKTILASIVEEMLTRFPECWSMWTTAGRVLVEHFQDIERGCQVSQQGTKLQPLLADTWLHHGQVLILARQYREAVEALKKAWELLPDAGYLQSVPAAFWLGESYRVLKNAKASKRWWEVAAQGCQELRLFNPAMADYWLGRVMMGLGDKSGARRAYTGALSQQLLYPVRGEVEGILEKLKR
ncbi:tetratricopeptide repeat protein [Dolichospermum circinale]|uniref:tetratricopeptide repeat protein n=1 Tax=Dolichospermum circinale TaxID=109265 RepID=UPI000418AFA5|nr:tetratricopeptide repeat protein [Dolichospermum circinale]MDB9475908.1 tetratricopeptide repeat protein [Dolichospermum circinale CS-537/11]MDB9479466.1 tetratricopeptide repeat protein [Dolichospermum circinale CS-537/03]MDB9482623.1 tetratricopeptide repeat protein [Dolichospermum circinale CS-537/05]